ncbi:MAG: 2,3-bisphosphoglycerate-independent phosphoglycerate mutase [Kiloniellales bacterium]|nr:2,3-bisphosphoglycerate-independent phosphoglycerate mutase [Kiloniellales bacterium]MDJ0980405.1 2,3-bisphosphoglycerate-independent phosphoglycerate mutase [Kiloniellales bacterium]
MIPDARPRPVVLCILDGWGHSDASEDNAIRLARTPTLDRLYAACPQALIDASEHEVGLPEGQMGNSEVGHMNIGAGRIVLQDLPRIDQAVRSGEIESNPALRGFIEKLKASGGTAQVMGLMSPGGVHAHQDQIAALCRILAAAGLPVKVHAFLDGRDTPPSSARGYLADFIAAAPDAEIVTVSGRYYAMDRDKRWDRVERAYRALVSGEGVAAADPLAAIDASYAKDVTDEFVEPAVVGGYPGMAEGDGVLMANFRADRAREILAALLDPDFEGFQRGREVRFAAAAGLVEYSEAHNRWLDTLFPAFDIQDTLGEVVAKAGLKQLRIAETEKYAHVTFFLNGGREAVFDGEERILIPSPKVATYDLKPEMSAFEVTTALTEAIETGRFDLIVVNYANGDMVGHTGKLDAAIQAVEAVDTCLGELADAVERAGGCLLITADHGNAESMKDSETGERHTAHTMNRVPILLAAAAGDASAALADGRLADIAPTVLALMGLTAPAAMTGRSLLRDPAAEAAAE